MKAWPQSRATLSPTPLGPVGVDHWWMRNGACTSRIDLPWTEDRHLVETDREASMAAVCGTCPVLATCQDYAATTGASGGFWAGRFRDRASHDTTALFDLDDPNDDPNRGDTGQDREQERRARATRVQRRHRARRRALAGAHEQNSASA